MEEEINREREGRLPSAIFHQRTERKETHKSNHKRAPPAREKSLFQMPHEEKEERREKEDLRKDSERAVKERKMISSHKQNVTKSENVSQKFMIFLKISKNFMKGVLPSDCSVCKDAWK